MSLRIFLFALITLLWGACAPADEVLVLGERPPVPQWQVETGGAIDRAPQVVDDVVVVIPQNGHMMALDRYDGQERWQYPRSVWHRAFAVDEQRVYVGVQGGQVAALNAGSGKEVWLTDLGIEVQVPPLVYQDLLLVSTTFVGPGLESNPQGRAALFALDRETGAIRWSFESENYILQTPAVAAGRVFVGGSYLNPEVDVEEGGPTQLYALSLADGSWLWRYRAEDGFIKSIYATEERVAYLPYQDFITGLDARTGRQVWRGDTGNWVPAMAGEGRVLYFGSANTQVHAWDISTGSVRWNYNIGGGAFNYVLGAPALQAGMLYFLTQQGDMLALDAASGEERWQIHTGIAAREGVSVAGNWLYVGDSEGVVYGYQARP